jgi:hypothetical protein
MADQKDLLTGAEFAAMARVTLRAVRAWSAKGVGPKPLRPPGSRLVRYRRDEVETWLRGEAVPPRVAS